MDQSQTLWLRYELVNVNELPLVNLTRSIKSVIFTKRGLARFNWRTNKLNQPMLILYTTSFATDIAMLMGTASLRVDILKCLLWTYEFWFLLLTNVTNCAVAVLYFGDSRMGVVLSFWLGAQLNICIDANLQTKQLARASLTAAVYVLCVLISVMLQLTPGSKTVTVFKYSEREMSNNDVLVSTTSIILIYMSRTAYRKPQHSKKPVDQSSTIRCVTYQCRVKFQVQQPRRPVVGPGHESLTISAETRTASAVMVSQKLWLVPLDVALSAKDVICLRVVDYFGGLNATSADLWETRALYGIGACSLVLNMVPFVWKYPFQSATSFALYCRALACAFCFFGAFVASFNRKLLRELLVSFDFCFLSVQFSAVHLCICDLFLWDARCFNVLFVWLTIHWVLLLDALTPGSRMRLGLQIRAAIPLVAFIIAAICRVSLILVSIKPSQPIHDRVLWQVQILDHTIEFRVAAFILNRLWMVFLWRFCIMWRLWTSDENGRIVLQGAIEFLVNRAAFRQYSRRTSISTCVSQPKLAKRSNMRVAPSGSAASSPTSVEQVAN